jgi:phospholipid/cholesterol/gamma-HCH transport system substrate-binding protein
MAKRGDEVKVGVMVMGVGAILIITVFMMIHYNPFQPLNDEYRINLRFAGGLEKDSLVRFGGVRRGKVVSVRLAPGDASAVELIVSLQKGTPVREDSVARLASLNALGENYVEISPGRAEKPLLKPGQAIRSEETPEFGELLAKINRLSEDARKLIGDLNKNLNRISENADTLLGNLNEATGPRNRKALSSMLDGANSMVSNANDLISRSSPRIDAIASNLQSTTERLPPLMQRIEEATNRTNRLVEQLNDTLEENRPGLKKDLEALESTLAEARKLLTDVSSTLDTNRNDIDSLMENFRRSSENLREFTDTIKQRPFSLIRIKPKPERKVPK